MAITKLINISDLTSYRENNRIEAKKAKSQIPGSVWETYSSFANTEGGIILLGVEELPNHSLVAVGVEDTQKLKQDFWNQINNPQKVSVNILLEKMVREEHVLNTLARADHYGRQGIVIRRNLTELHFANPGDFRVDLESALQGGNSDPRNTFIMKMFGLVGVGDRAGSGMPDAIAVMENELKGKVTYTVTRNPDRTRLDVTIGIIVTGDKRDDKVTINLETDDKTDDKPTIKSESDDKTDDKRTLILDFIREKREVKTDEIAEYVGLRSTRVKEILYELLEEGLIERRGSNRNRTYKIK